MGTPVCGLGEEYTTMPVKLATAAPGEGQVSEFGDGVGHATFPEFSGFA